MATTVTHRSSSLAGGFGSGGDLHDPGESLATVVPYADVTNFAKVSENPHIGAEFWGQSSGDSIHNYRLETFFGPGFCRRNTRPRFFSRRF